MGDDDKRWPSIRLHVHDEIFGEQQDLEAYRKYVERPNFQQIPNAIDAELGPTWEDLAAEKSRRLGRAYEMPDGKLDGIVARNVEENRSHRLLRSTLERLDAMFYQAMAIRIAELGPPDAEVPKIPEPCHTGEHRWGGIASSTCERCDHHEHECSSCGHVWLHRLPRGASDAVYAMAHACPRGCTDATFRPVSDYIKRAHR